jgi:putative SOS response-associated peptidase YedK
MCGRFVSSTPPDQLARYFDVDAMAEALADRGPNYNTAPTTSVLAVYSDGSARRLEAFRWGLVPSWAKDVSIGNRLINARAETVATKPSFRSAFARRRCIVPADGFYEWTRPGGADRKQPYFIHRPDGEPFAFAGLWEEWRGSPKRSGDDDSDPSGGALPPADPLRSCTIVTTEANSAMSELHDRMPVILPRSAWDEWLSPEVTDTEMLGKFLVPAPTEIIRFHAVSTEVNSARNKGAHLVEPAPVDPAPVGEQLPLNPA